MNPQINRNYPQKLDFKITNPDCDFFDGIDRDARDREPLVIDADWYDVTPVAEDNVEVIEYDDTADRVIEVIDVGLYYVATGVKTSTYYTAFAVAYVVKYTFVAMWWMIASIASAVFDVSRQNSATNEVAKKPVVNVTTTVNVGCDATVNVHTDVNVR